MRAAVTAMGRPQEDFDVVLIQLVNLLRDGKPVSMSTRAGTFETLADVSGERRGRFMFLSRRRQPSGFRPGAGQTTQPGQRRPYYVQYAHARISTVLRRAAGAPPDAVTDLTLPAGHARRSGPAAQSRRV